MGFPSAGRILTVTMLDSATPDCGGGCDYDICPLQRQVGDSFSLYPLQRGHLFDRHRPFRMDPVVLESDTSVRS